MKVRTLAAALVVAAAPVLLPATQAFAATSNAPGGCSTTCTSTWVPPTSCSAQCGANWDTIPSFAEQEAIFINGGADLGRGAGELVTSGVVGLAQGILDLPAHLLGFPKPLLYVPCP